MRECPTCRSCFSDDILHCPDDGAATTSSISGEPILDGRYQLEKRLGQGGMGVVFKARHIFLKTAHAIKIILPDLVGNDPNLVTRFRQEALAAAAIRHQNIIAVTDFGVVRGTMPFLVMEFVQGKSLQDIMAEEGAMSPLRAFELMQPICAGIAAAHRQGIVHRDLKPLNVMICDDLPMSEAVKILDFGLAKIKSGELLGSFIAAQTTGLMGSPFYMAPEQWSDEPPDARADVYSLGAMFYEMVTGNPPFRANNLAGLIAKHLQEPPPPFPHSYGIPPALEPIYQRAMAKDRNQRQPDAIAFGRELETALTTTTGYQPAATLSRHASWKWIAIAGGLLVMLVGVIGIGFALKFGLKPAVNQKTPPPVERPTVVSTSSEDLRGEWAGTYGPLGYATKLVIKNQNGTEFDGTLEQGSIRVVFKGTYDSGSRTLTMKQTRVLSGEGWSLGEDVGKLSADGKEISGTGKDELGASLGMSYQFSFRRR